jgi:LysM repeat protein
MRVIQTIILLVIGLLIFGSAGFFGYQLFIKPGRAEKQEIAAQAAAPAPTATPDPGIPELQKLKVLQDAGKLDEARDGLNLWITHYPQSTLLGEALQRLGAANMALLFQSGGTNVESYTVIKGDSLARIASKHHSNAELIQKANSLPNINLQIGEILVIPSLKISLELDRSAKTLTLLNNGSFLKEYTLLSSPASTTKENLNSKVLDKIATSGNKRVAFGDKAYPKSDRSILLAQAPPIVAPLPTPATQGTNAPTPPPLPGGYVLSSADLLEVFPLISRNTPVIIH